MLNRNLKEYIKTIFNIKSENLVIGSFTELTNKEAIIADRYTIGNVAFTEKDVKVNFFEEYCGILLPSLADKLVNQNPDKTLQEIRNIIAHYYGVLDIFDKKENLNRKELFEKREAEEAVVKYEKKLNSMKNFLDTHKLNQNEQNPVQKLIQETAFNCEKASNKMPAGRLTMRDSEDYILPYFNLNLDDIYNEIERLKPQDISEYKYKYEYKKVEWSVPKGSRNGLLQINDNTAEESDVLTTNNNDMADTIKEQSFSLDSLVIGYQYITKKDIVRGDWYNSIVYNLNLRNKDTIKINAKNDLEELGINACKIPVSAIIAINPAVIIKGISKEKVIEEEEVVNEIFYGLFSYTTIRNTENFKINESKEGTQFIKDDNVANVIAYEVMDVCQKKLFNSFYLIYKDLDKKININKLTENLFLEYVNKDLSKIFINHPFDPGILSGYDDVINNFLYHAGDIFFRKKQKINNKGFLDNLLYEKIEDFNTKYCYVIEKIELNLESCKYLQSEDSEIHQAQLSVEESIITNAKKMCRLSQLDSKTKYNMMIEDLSYIPGDLSKYKPMITTSNNKLIERIGDLSIKEEIISCTNMHYKVELDNSCIGFYKVFSLSLEYPWFSREVLKINTKNVDFKKGGLELAEFQKNNFILASDVVIGLGMIVESTLLGETNTKYVEKDMPMILGYQLQDYCSESGFF